jgi:hypothetical protein
MNTVKMILTGCLAVSLIGCTVKPESKSWTFDFTDDYAGFESVFADYHADGHNFETYEMDFDRTEIPGTTTQGLRLQGHNRSDDLFMGVVKALDGLKPLTRYRITLSFTVYTDAEAGSIGIGGSPADSVYVKAGFANQ